MNYTEFVNAVKEKLTRELNGGVRVNVYTTKKNNDNRAYRTNPGDAGG